MIITLGVFYSALEFDLTVLAAVLAVVGYSLNDTIVVPTVSGKTSAKSARQPGGGDQ